MWFSNFLENALALLAFRASGHRVFQSVIHVPRSYGEGHVSSPVYGLPKGSRYEFFRFREPLAYPSFPTVRFEGLRHTLSITPLEPPCVSLNISHLAAGVR